MRTGYSNFNYYSRYVIGTHYRYCIGTLNRYYIGTQYRYCIGTQCVMGTQYWYCIGAHCLCDLNSLWLLRFIHYRYRIGTHNWRDSYRLR